jgi:hypothetical protein
VGLPYYMEEHYRIYPYELVYGKYVILPIDLEVKTLRTTLQLGMDL